MPTKKDQEMIERELCKDSKYATYLELILDRNRKLVLDFCKEKQCYDE